MNPGCRDLVLPCCHHCVMCNVMCNVQCNAQYNSSPSSWQHVYSRTLQTAAVSAAGPAHACRHAGRLWHIQEIRFSMSRAFNYRCNSVYLWCQSIHNVMVQTNWTDYLLSLYTLYYIILYNVLNSILSWTVDTCEDSMRNLSTLSNSKPDNALNDINDVSIHRIVLLQTLQRLVCHQLD